MTTFIIPYEGEPLIKAVTKTKPLKQNLGSWQGLPIVAIGPKGGKIVGYGSGGKPIYAGSKQAKTLAVISKQEGTKKTDSTGEWLLALGIPNKIEGNAVYVTPEAAELLETHFNVVGTKVGGAMKFSFTEVYAHVGEPLKPQGDEQQTWAATMAAGEIDEDPFPDLKTLKQIPAGKYAGSHGNLLFEDPTGRKWIFKGEDPTIARAEEAASRIGRLIMGDKVPPARMVEIQGQSGVLVGELPGEPMNEANHSNPPGKLLTKYRKDIAKHFVVDWLTSNHDGHAGNFLADGDQLNGIDKGQAWKFFGKDKLDKDYSPNPSNPIYNKFWNAVQTGLIDVATILPALGEALDSAEQITDKQFKSIIAPYVTTAAGHIGFDPQKKAAAMTKRLDTLRSDLEGFLSDLTGKKVQIPKKSADNFETMPEPEPEPEKEEAKWAAIGAITGSKYDQLTEAGYEVKWKEDVLPTDEVDPGYGVGPLPGAKADALKKKGLVVVKVKPKFTIDVPGKPKVIEGGAEAPVDTTGEKVPGWPATKGKVTIAHPGEPSPGGKWPKGYPGPGFNASITYKKQKFTVEFIAGGEGNLAVGVYYPDGSKQIFASPNQASDSMYLFTKGLPLNMSATEKKKQGISLPAKKAFGIVAFKDELMKAHAGELPTGAKTPSELEKEGVIEKGAPELTTKAVISKMPDGVLDDWEEMPQEVNEAVLANEYAIGKDYPAAIVPGLPYKATEDGEPVIYVVKKGTDPIEYMAFEWYGDNMVVGENTAMLIDEALKLHDDPMLQSIKKDILADVTEPVTADEKIGAPPPAELPKEAKVPENAPKHHKGPVPPGAEIKVKKKFPWGKAEVMLLALDEGKFQIVLPDEEANFKVETFDSLSAASDWVWVNQKGYPDAEAYKQATGKNKIPSGGGWKFWGIKPGATPAPKQKVPKTKDGAPGMQNLDAFPETHALYAYPVGTVLIWQQGGKVYKAKKTEDIKWDLHTPHKGLVKNVHQASLDSFQPTAETVKIKVPEAKPEPHPSIAEDNFETMPDVPEQANLEGMATGTILKFSTLSADYTATKLPDGTWELVYGAEKDIETSKYMGQLFNTIKKNKAEDKEPPLEVEVKAPPAPAEPPAIPGYSDPLEGMPTLWSDLTFKLEQSFLQSQPEGTQFKVNGVVYVKTGGGGAIWQNTKTGKGLFPGALYEEIKDQPIQMRALDTKTWMAKVEAGEVWAKLDKPEGFTTFDVLEQLPEKAILKLDGVEYVHGMKDGNAVWIAPDKATFSDYFMADKVDDAVDVQVLKKPGEKQPSAPAAKPSEANWQTMPDMKTDSEYAAKLAALPVDTMFKLNSDSGKQWTAIKESDTTYKLTSPSGKVISKGEVGMAAFMLGMASVVYQQEGAAFDPFAAILAGPEKATTDIPAVPDIVKTAIEKMVSGDSLQWEEHGNPYRITKEGDAYKVEDVDSGNVMASDINAEAAGGYISWSADPKQFKLTGKSSAPIESGWENIEKKLIGPKAAATAKGPNGTTFKFWNTATGQMDVVTKIDNNKWYLASTNGYLSNDEVIYALNVSIGKKGAVQKQILDLSKAPKPPPAAPTKSQEQIEQELKAKEISDWAEAHGPVTDQNTLHILSHVQNHFDLYDPGMGAWARMDADGEHVLMGSDNPKFEKFINDMKKTSPGFEFEWVETPMGKFAKFMPEAIAAALPGNPAGTMQGPDGKTYPNGTTFKEKQTKYTKEELLKKDPNFYKIKPHKDDPDSVVVKVSGTGDAQKKALMEMMVNAKVPFTAGKDGLPIVGGANVIVFAKKADLEKHGKTEVTIEANIPPQPKAFQPKAIPFVSAPTGYKELMTPDQIKGVPGMVLPRMGRAIAMGKPGVFRDNHLKVRRVRGADGKVYTEFYGTLAQTKTLSAKKGWESGNVSIPSAVNVSSNLTPFDLHNYDWDTGLSIEKPGTDPTYTESGYNNTTDGGSTIAVHRGQESMKNMFRIRIEDGQDIEKELGDAFQKMGYKKKDVFAPVDATTERIWKKWALVRGAMGPVGFQKELRKDVKETWDEKWLDAQLEAKVPDYQTKLDSMVLQETFQGHPTWLVMSDVETYKDAGWSFAQRVDSHYMSLYFQLTQGAGWAAQKTKGQAGSMKMGQSGGGMSASSDIVSGGSDTIFFRAHKSWANASDSDGVIMHPRAFLRTDWRRYHGDAYGNITGKGSGAGYVNGAPGRYEELNTTGTECVWQGGAPISDIMCVTVTNQGKKDELMKHLKADGIEQVNGVPLDDFILVGDHDMPNRIHPSLRPGPEWGDEWK